MNSHVVHIYRLSIYNVYPMRMKTVNSLTENSTTIKAHSSTLFRHILPVHFHITNVKIFKCLSKLSSKET